MRFAEQIRAQFDESSKSSGSKGRKKKRKGGPSEPEMNNSKTPRLVIKFSKGSTVASSNTSAKENGGRDEYDFDDSAPGLPPPVVGPNPRGVMPTGNPNKL